MDKKLIHLIYLLIIGFYGVAQDVKIDSNTSFLKRIFLPSFDVGYQINNSELLWSSVKVSTSLEYRIRNNNDFFIRINYDTYGSRYKLEATNNLINAIEGSVQMTDLFIAPGYRWGDNTFRVMVSAMPGIKFYEFPSASLNGTQVEISQKGRSVFTSSFLGTIEYYFDEKSAFTISLSQNQVWKRVDFWPNKGSAYCISVGFITSLL